MVNPFDDTNPLLAFLEDEPRAGYFAHQGRWRTPNKKKFFQSQFGDIHDEYLGMLGQKIMAGQEPTDTFTGYVGNYDWDQAYAGLTPRQRGQGGDQLNPMARWIFPR